ncbi:MAG: ParA family protein [Nitrosopumilus sp.]|nr:ParA family protein [Nitrosopumilus sp.]
MKVLTIANRKGGAGKSTCAAHLAVAATNSGYKAILIDMDPQKTLEGWWQKREEDTPLLVETTALDLPNSIDKLRTQGFDICIIDTPGDSGDFTRAGIMAADLVIIPSKPTPPDLSAIGRTISLVEENKKKFAFVITQGIVRTKATLQALSVLSQFGAVAPAPISNRTAYASAMGAGKSAGDFDKIAEEEINQVWGFIRDTLFKSEKITKKKLIA